MSIPTRLNDRYQVKARIAQGGMGEVYKADDTRMGCEVAIKIMRDSPEPKALEMFEKEWRVLAGWDTPNVVTIFDRGEYQDEGVAKPFFVMPLLRGATLADLIRSTSLRLTVERSINIIHQACKGLQAAHDRGLIHRDLKPSNIFVMADDSVKIIDFGVAHIVAGQSTRTPIGTLPYMAPEQLEMKALSPLSDIFSLGVVSYETLSGRRPFDGPTEQEIMAAILQQIPPPASDYNPAVSEAVSRVVHKAMAKQSWHRFSSASAFAEALQKALRGEPIELFDPDRIQPRLQRARKAYEQSDHQFAAEILNELEAEGNLDSEISALRRQINQAVRQKTISQLMEGARTRLDEDEYPLALQRVHQVLELDPGNAAALGLKSTIEKKNKERKIEGWFRLAHQHVSNHDYGHAREAIENVLKDSPQEGRALQLLDEVDYRAEEYARQRQEKQQLFKAAQEAWEKGELSTALDKMAAVLDLDRQAPDTTSPAGSATYQNFYNRVRSEHDAIKRTCGEARMHLKDRNFGKALMICDEYLTKYPNQALLQALKLEVEEQQRQHLSEFIAQTDRRVEGEPDLDKRVSILQEALELHPGEAHFEKALRLMREKRDLVNAIAAKARFYEEQGQFNEALGQWEILGTIYASHPGLNIEVERLVKRRHQQALSAAKARWVENVDRNLQSGDYSRALEACRKAQAEFPNDPELIELEKRASLGSEIQARVQTLVTQGQGFYAQQCFEEGLEALRNAYRLDERSRLARAVLCDTLAERGQKLLEVNWHAAETLVEEALGVDPGHPLAKSLRTLIGDRKQQEFVDRCIASARQLQAAGDLARASAEVGRGLGVYPQEPRLSQLRMTLAKEVLDSQRQTAGRGDMEERSGLERNSEVANNVASMRGVYEGGQSIASRSLHDDFPFPATKIGCQLPTMTSRIHAEPSVEEWVKSAEPPAPPPTPSGHDSKHTSIGRRLLPQESVPTAPGWGRVPLRLGSVAVPGGAIGVAAAIVALVLGVELARRILKPPPPPPSHAIAVRLDTSPPAAKILLDGKVLGASPQEVLLPEGTYRIDALKDGYQQLSRSLIVKRGSPVSLNLPLILRATTLRVLTDLQAPQIWLDGQAAGEMKNGLLVLDLAAGPHEIRVSDRDVEATIPLEAPAGIMPGLTGAITAKELKTVIVSTLGNHGSIQCNFGSTSVAVDGEPKGEMGSASLELNDLSSGPHVLTWGQGKEQTSRQFELGAPALTILLISDRAVGNLLVRADQDDACVWVDGKQRGFTKKGVLRISNLPAMPHVVRITKEGYEGNPEQRTVKILKGNDGLVEFKLTEMKAADPVPDPRVRLQKQALDAYTNQHYVFPAGENAIAYWKQLLALDPQSDYYQARLIDSLHGAEYQAGQALRQNDFARARQIADALSELLPDRSKEVSSLREDIQQVQARYDKENRLPPVVPPAFSTRVRHMHEHKAYCEGILSVSDHQLRFHGESASEGAPHDLSYACSAIVFKKLRHNQFEVRTDSGKPNQFAPVNVSEFDLGRLQSACAQ